MGLFVNFFEFFNRIVGVNLRRRQATVSQQIFNRIKVGTVVEQVCRKGVTKYVRATFLERRDRR